MLYDTPYAQEQSPFGGLVRVYYPRTGEETKVSIHALRALLGFIT